MPRSLGGAVFHYNSNPKILIAKYGTCRGASRMGREGLTYQTLKSGEIQRRVCLSCRGLALCVPSGLCISCQVKKPITKHYYVKPGTIIRKCKRRAKAGTIPRGLYPVGTILTCSPMLAYSSTKQNELEAIIRRVCMPTPPIIKEFQQDFCRWFSQKTLSVINDYPFVFKLWDMNDIRSWSREYGGKESGVLCDLWAFVLEHLIKHGSIPEVTDLDIIVLAFLKWEKDNGFDESGPIQKAPRLIQGFSRLVKILTACVVTQVQNWFHQVVGILFPGCRYSAGDTIVQLNEWYLEHEHEGICGVDDFTSYDSLCSEEHHGMALQFYENIGCPMWFLDIRSRQISPVGQTRHGVEFWVPGTMRSGAADTSLWNTVLSLAAHTYCSQLLGGKLSIVAMGDDCLFFSNKDWNYGSLGQLLENLGFLCKLTWGLEPWERVYLNMLPYPVEGGVCFGPLLGRMLSRLGWSIERRNDPFEYLGQIGEAFLAPCNHIPVLRSFFSNMAAMRFSAIKKKNNLIYGQYKHTPFLTWKGNRLVRCGALPMIEECVMFLCCRYSCTPTDIYKFEDFIKQETKAPSVLSHSMCDVVCLVDC